MLNVTFFNYFLENCIRKGNYELSLEDRRQNINILYIFNETLRLKKVSLGNWVTLNWTVVQRYFEIGSNEINIHVALRLSIVRGTIKVSCTPRNGNIQRESIA